jgi:hypothetical protein
MSATKVMKYVLEYKIIYRLYKIYRETHLIRKLSKIRSSSKGIRHLGYMTIWWEDHVNHNYGGKVI